MLKRLPAISAAVSAPAVSWAGVTPFTREFEAAAAPAAVAVVDACCDVVTPVAVPAVLAVPDAVSPAAAPACAARSAVLKPVVACSNTSSRAGGNDLLLLSHSGLSCRGASSRTDASICCWVVILEAMLQFVQRHRLESFLQLFLMAIRKA